MDTTRLIGELLHGWQTHDRCGQNENAEWEIAAVFAHDYEDHLLVWQWVRDTNGVLKHVGFGLWFVTVEGIAVPVKQYPQATRPPLIDAAAQVMKWGELCRSANQW
jgi:hypothetical protein